MCRTHSTQKTRMDPRHMDLQRRVGSPNCGRSGSDQDRERSRKIEESEDVKSSVGDRKSRSPEVVNPVYFVWRTWLRVPGVER